MSWVGDALIIHSEQSERLNKHHIFRCTSLSGQSAFCAIGCYCVPFGTYRGYGDKPHPTDDDGAHYGMRSGVPGSFQISHALFVPNYWLARRTLGRDSAMSVMSRGSGMEKASRRPKVSPRRKNIISADPRSTLSSLDWRLYAIVGSGPGP